MKQFVIGDFLKRIKKPIEIEDGVIYKRVTISGNHKGVSMRDNVNGSIIGTKKQFTVIGGDFIMSKIDARNGAFGIIPLDLDGAIITGNFWTYKVDTDLVDTEWFFYFTHSYNFIQICIESSTGSTHRKYIDEKVFLNHKINLPSKSEQTEMVERYKKSSKISNKLNSEIKTQKQLLTNLKQAILQEAIQGKLTEEWRIRHIEIVSGSHSAENLLKRIKTEKEQLVKEGKIKKEKPLPPITQEEIPYELSNGWVWCKLGDLCSKITDGFHNTPPKVDSGFPYIAATHVKSDKIDWNSAHKVSEKYHRELHNKTKPIKGEILVVNIGAGSGCPAIIDVDFEFSFKNTAILKFNQTLVCNKYLFFYLISIQDENYKMLTRGANQPFLSLKVINNFNIPLPPLEEQKAIVKKVETLMQKCTALEEEIKLSETNAQMLMQTVLKEAFES